MQFDKKKEEKAHLLGEKFERHSYEFIADKLSVHSF